MFRKTLASWFFFTSCLVIANAQSDTSSIQRKSFAVSAGIGVSLVDATGVVDYVNDFVNYQSVSSTKQDDFATAVEFFGSAEVQVSESWGMKAEYSYLLKTYEIPQVGASPFSFSYGVHMPLLMVQYLIPEKGYTVKFGGGLGYHLAHFVKDASFYGSDEYTSTGVGIKLEAEANTEFDEHLYGLISVEVRGAVMGEFKDSQGNFMVDPVRQKDATMSFFSIGTKFGLIYYL